MILCKINEKRNIMKKKRILLMLFTVLLLCNFVSCNGETNADFLAGDYLVAGRWIKSYDLYLQVKNMDFASNCDMSSFVLYEEISMLGDFCAYACFDREIKSGVCDYRHIAYLLKDTSGTEFELHIFHLDETKKSVIEGVYQELPELDISDIDSNSHMKSLLLGYSGGNFVNGGVSYIYTHGKLECVKWIYGEYEFMLCNLDEYPVGQHITLVEKMLDITTTNDAVFDFISAFDTARSNR